MISYRLEAVGDRRINRRDILILRPQFVSHTRGGRGEEGNALPPGRQYTKERNHLSALTAKGKGGTFCFTKKYSTPKANAGRSRALLKERKKAFIFIFYKTSYKGISESFWQEKRKK